MSKTTSALILNHLALSVKDLDTSIGFYKELFDLQEDPQEINNLYTIFEFQPIVGRLKKRMAKLEQQYQVPAKDPF